MSFDGAPWKKIPLDSIIDIELSYHSQVNILANGVCPAKRSNHDSSQPSTSGRNEDNNAPCASRTDDDNNAPSASRSGDDNNAPGASITDDSNAKDKSKKPKFGGTKTFQKRAIT